MKPTFFFIFLFLSGALALHGQESGRMRVIFYRPSTPTGAAEMMKIKLNDEERTKITLLDNSFFVYEGKPGTLVMIEKHCPAGRIALRTEAGKKYYVQATYSQAGWVLESSLTLTDSASGYYATHNQESKDLNKPARYFRHLQRIALELNVGEGFHKTNVGVSPTGQDVKISFGGGVGIALNYGAEIAKHLDLSVSAEYQKSRQSPRLDNASTAFTRWVFSPTAAFIIPINKGYLQRMRLGVGPDVYVANTLNVDMLKAGGFNDTWSYKEALGFHASFIYEFDRSQRFGYIMGVKYTWVNYSFASGKQFAPPGPDLRESSGQGFFITTGMFFRL